MLAKSEVQTGILGGLVTHTTFSLVVKDKISRIDSHARTHAIPIRLRADQKNFQPVIRVTSVVAKQLRCLAVVAHQNVEVSIVVEVADGGTPADARQGEITAELITDVLKDASPTIAKHQLRLGVLRARVVALDVIEDVAVLHQKITETVVVVVQETGAESTHVKCVI